MTLDYAAVVKGHEDEDRVRDELERRAWTVRFVGARVAGLSVDDVVQEPTNVRHAPDLYARRRPGEAYYVEVVCNTRDTIALEIAKLRAMDVWDEVVPVVFVNAHDGATWRHNREWASYLISDATTRTRVGSGDPFGVFQRNAAGFPAERPFNHMFGEPNV